MGDNTETTTFSVRGDLSPEFLRYELSPFLCDLADLQHIIDDMRGVPSSSVTINRLEAVPSDSLAEGLGMRLRLSEKDINVEAWQALGELGRADEAAHLLLALARDERVDAGVRQRVAKALGELGRADEAAHLLLTLTLARAARDLAESLAAYEEPSKARVGDGR